MHPQKTSRTSYPTLTTYSAEKKEYCLERLQARSRSREWETIKSKASNPSARRGNYGHSSLPTGTGTLNETATARQP